MGIRETLNRNPAVASAAGGALVLLALVVVAVQVFGGGNGATGRSGEQRFYSTDNGATWFADDAQKLAPFDHEGKEAIRVIVYECGGTEFVNHFERYTPEGKEAMAKLREAVKKGPPPGLLVAAAQMRGREVKRPGDAEWTSAADRAKTAEITTPQCPPDASGEPQIVSPE